MKMNDVFDRCDIVIKQVNQHCVLPVCHPGFVKVMFTTKYPYMYPCPSDSLCLSDKLIIEPTSTHRVHTEYTHTLSLSLALF